MTIFPSQLNDLPSPIEHVHFPEGQHPAPSKQNGFPNFPGSFKGSQHFAGKDVTGELVGVGFAVVGFFVVGVLVGTKLGGTQIPPQSAPVGGAQSSRGSSTQTKPDGHCNPAIPPQNLTTNKTKQTKAQTKNFLNFFSSTDMDRYWLVVV